MNGVAVLIAAKDAAATVGRAVGSALAQRAAAEVILVDDGSIDGTAAAAAAMDDGTGRLRVIRLPDSRGPSAARNRALEASAAPMACVLDADDFMLPGRIDRLLAAAGDGWDFAADDLLLATQGGESAPHRPMLGLASRTMLGFDAFVAGNIADPRRPRQELGYLKPLMRRPFLDRLGLRYDERVRLGEDYLLYAAALARGARIHLVPACGYVAVARPDSLSHRHRAEDLLALAEAEAELEHGSADLPRSVAAALRRHRQHVMMKYRHRMALEAKRQRRPLALARHLFATPATAWHIAAETIRARRAALPRGGP